MISDLERDYCTANDLPLPSQSIEERLQQMCIFRPGHTLFRARCTLTGKSLLSSVPPDRGLTVYDVDAWLGSEWDAQSYGRPYDFSRPFFEQFAELMRVVPFPSLSGTHASLENSGYCNFVTAAKNCYLVFSGQNLEDCLYGRFLYHSRDILDCVYIRHSECCYGSFDLQSCYNLHFSEHCQHCSDSMFLSGCRSCKDCFACANLANKQFCWQNEQLSEDEWHARRGAIDLGDSAILAACSKSFRQFAAGQPIRCVHGDRYEDSSGNFLNQVSGCTHCYLVSESESLADCIWVNKSRSCICTVGFGGDSELLYNSTGVGNRAYNVKFGLQCRQNVRDLEYCMLVEASSHDCFGCISVRNGSYCILNKAYPPDEYFSLLTRIKAHMRSTGEYGKFFPIEMSPYAYNESDAALFFPLERSAAESLGFWWSEDVEPPPALDAAVLPAHISRAGDEILRSTFVCRTTGRGYRLQRRELEFLRRIGVALPEDSPFERIRRRGEFLRWRPVRSVRCAACSEVCSTVYDDPAAQIYCERCYQRLLVE